MSSTGTKSYLAEPKAGRDKRILKKFKISTTGTHMDTAKTDPQEQPRHLLHSSTAPDTLSTATKSDATGAHTGWVLLLLLLLAAAWRTSGAGAEADTWARTCTAAARLT